MQRITSYNDCRELADYVDIVKTGKVKTCKEQKQLIAYIENCIEQEELYFDPEQVSEYMSYQKYFPFDLYAWEKYVFVLHNCVFLPNGLPRWSDLFVYMGRGGGKNGYLSFEDFCLTTPTNGIRQYHIDICANSEEQAKTSFDEIYDVLENPQSKELGKKLRHNFKWNKTEIINLATGSKIKYRTNNAKSKDGMRSGKVDFDEIHAFEDWANLNVFTTGLGKKACPRITYVTTDGDVRDGPLDALKERAFAILKGERADNGFLPFVCRLDDDEEVHDESNWPKANPSLPYKPELMQEIRSRYQEYLDDPVKNSGFMTKRMNRPQGRADVQVTSWENILKTNRPVPDLTGQPCVIGIDFTKTTDFMSVFTLFKGKGNVYYGEHHSWFCTRSKDKGRIKAPLQEFVDMGLLTMVDDVEIPAQILADYIKGQKMKYNVRRLAADNYRWSILSRAITSIGFDARDREQVMLVRPSNIMFTQTKIDSLFNSGNIIWGNDPLMRWFTNNTKLEPAPNNNFKYGKIEGKSRKTDGFMAFVHAMCAEDALPDYYEPVYLEPITF